MINLRTLLYSVGIHVITLVVLFVMPSMNLMSKPKEDVITVQLLQGVPTGSLKPSMPPPEPEVEAKGIESEKPVETKDDAKPIELEKPDKPEVKPEKKPEKKVDSPKKKIETKKRNQNTDKNQTTKKKVKELDAAALANAQDSGDGDAPVGSPLGTATVDNASFTYAWWMTETFNKIQSNMRNTVQTEERLSCTIYFQVLRSGRVAELKMVIESGSSYFDRDCLEAIERSVPLPALPDEFKDEIIGITLPFTNGY